MRRIRLALGATLATLAAATLVAQLLSLLAHGAYVPLSLAAIWQAADADALERVRAAVEGGAAAPAWPSLAWLLRLPAWLVIGLMALPLLLAGRRSRHGGFE